MLAVKKVVSPVRFFDERQLDPVPLGERTVRRPARRGDRASGAASGGVRGGGYGSGGTEPNGRGTRSEPLRRRIRCSPAIGVENERSTLLREGEGAFVARPAPDDEQSLAVDAVAACLAGGRRAIVLVPEATPVPATATTLLDAFGDRAALFLGGGKRSRYRRWLEIAASRYDVVIGTRPAVFAPLE